MKPLRCEVCGDGFEAKRTDARTCSNKCRQTLHRRQHPRQAPQRRCASCERPIPPLWEIWDGEGRVGTIYEDVVPLAFLSAKALWEPRAASDRQPSRDLDHDRFELKPRPRRIDVEYCSNRCRQYAHRERENTIDAEAFAALAEILSRRHPDARY